MEQTFTKRIRISLNTSVKGIITPNITVEMIDTDKETVLKEVKELFLLTQKEIKKI